MPRRKGDGGSQERELLDQVLLLAMRPFLARCAEALLPRLELERLAPARAARFAVGNPNSPIINQAAERLLICGRCTGQWHFDAIACPYCENQRSQPHHVVHEPRRAVSHLRVRRLPRLPEGLRRP